MQTPHKLWPSQELRAIRDCLRTVLAAEKSTASDSQADTYDVASLISQIADCEKLFLHKSGRVRKNLEEIQTEITKQKQVIESLEAKAKWENHRRRTAEQQAQVAAEIADAYINESTTRDDNKPQTELAIPNSSSLNAKIQHIIDQNIFNERFKNESVNSLTLPLAQLDAALEQ